jgi:hypothetical protein
MDAAPGIATAALDALADAVLVVRDGRVLVANRPARRLTAGPLAPRWVADAVAGGGGTEVALGGGRIGTVTIAPCPLLPDGGAGRLVTVRDRSPRPRAWPSSRTRRAATG